MPSSDSQNTSTLAVDFTTHPNVLVNEIFNDPSTLPASVLGKVQRLRDSMFLLNPDSLRYMLNAPTREGIMAYLGTWSQSRDIDFGLEESSPHTGVIYMNIEGNRIAFAQVNFSAPQ